MVYAYSWYLNTVCENWDAIVEGDYETVMPLAYRKKYGIYYIYQPLFTQQLGVFSTKKLNQEKINEFLNAIPGKYKLIEAQLNTLNNLEQSNGFIIQKAVTYELDLIKPYEKARIEYSTNTRRNIEKSKTYSLTVSNNVSVFEFIDFYRNNLLKTQKFSIPAFEIDKLYILASVAVKTNHGIIYAVFDENGRMLAAAFFVYSHNKTILLISTSNEDGKEKRTMFKLIDEYIKINSGRNITLDFEGSMIEGVARFYAGFGAIPCSYIKIKKNKLPFYIRWFKK